MDNILFSIQAMKKLISEKSTIIKLKKKKLPLCHKSYSQVYISLRSSIFLEEKYVAWGIVYLFNHLLKKNIYLFNHIYLISKKTCFFNT